MFDTANHFSEKVEGQSGKKDFRVFNKQYEKILSWNNSEVLFQEIVYYLEKDDFMKWGAGLLNCLLLACLRDDTQAVNRKRFVYHEENGYLYHPR